MPPNNSPTCRKIKAASRSNRDLKGTNLFSILTLRAKDLKGTEKTPSQKPCGCPEVMPRQDREHNYANLHVKSLGKSSC